MVALMCVVAGDTVLDIRLDASASGPCCPLTGLTTAWREPVPRTSCWLPGSGRSDGGRSLRRVLAWAPPPGRTPLHCRRVPTKGPVRRERRGRPRRARSTATASGRLRGPPAAARPRPSQRRGRGGRRGARRRRAGSLVESPSALRSRYRGRDPAIYDHEGGRRTVAKHACPDARPQTTRESGRCCRGRTRSTTTTDRCRSPTR